MSKDDFTLKEGHQYELKLSNELVTPPFCITFFGVNNEVGRLYLKDKKLVFEGNAEESAKKFFEAMIKENESYVKEISS